MGKFETYETAWCPGCGNFAILNSLKTALEELGKEPKDVLMVAGIGQAAKTPQYISANSFCGLHGRALPAAVAAKIANDKLTVIVDSGDGDSYGEGGNHFIHNIRRNVNITHFVHDNQIYGLTKGQASPTSKEGHVTPVQTSGNINVPLNPMLMAKAAGAGFVARGFSGDAKQLVTLMKEAIMYPGYAFVDIMQPCISFNKINTFSYYKNAVRPVGDDYDPTDKKAAMMMAMEEDWIPTGILYKEDKLDFHRRHKLLKEGKTLIGQDQNKIALENLIESFI